MHTACLGSVMTPVHMHPTVGPWMENVNPSMAHRHWRAWIASHATMRYLATYASGPKGSRSK